MTTEILIEVPEEFSHKEQRLKVELCVFRMKNISLTLLCTP